MPIKLIGAILLAVIVAVLTGFNLTNKCSVWFFHNFTNVPVFALIIGAFLVGVIVTIPSTFGKAGLKKQLDKAKKDLRDKERQFDDTRIAYEAKLRNATGKGSQKMEAEVEELKSLEDNPDGNSSEEKSSGLLKKIKSKKVKKEN